MTNNMKRKLPNIKIGQEFSRLTTLGVPFYAYPWNSKVMRGVWFVVCKCACGKCDVFAVYRLANGTTTSCSCYRVERMKNRKKIRDKRIRIENDVAFIQIKNKWVIIDKEDLAKIINYSMWFTSRGYPIINTGNRNAIILSRFLTNCPDDYEVDHIDCNPLNNKKDNLRIATTRQNQKNRKPKLGKYKGVYERKDAKNNRWIATIGSDRKHYYLGAFSSPEDATKAYNKAAKKLHGEFAHLNIIGEQ